MKTVTVTKPLVFIGFMRWRGFIPFGYSSSSGLSGLHIKYLVASGVFIRETGSYASSRHLHPLYVGLFFT
jgi:hypothetical protein